MRVLPKKAASPIRQAVETPKPEATAYTFPAPIRGLVLNENIATAGPSGAQVLDNFICTTTGIKARAGSQKYGTLPGAVRSLFTYRSVSQVLFAADNTAIYDLSTSPDPLGASAVVTGQTGGAYSTAMFGTAGGNFLIAVNGADAAQVYDGASWSPGTITGVAMSSLSHVWSFANRLFFIEKDSMRVHYLPVDSIGGEVAQLSLAGVFKRGGRLLMGATWSIDAGDGLDDKCVIISDQGEVAVYQGTNPGDANAWSLAGRYEITQPLGPNATMQAGGDLLVATQAGMVPMSAAIQKDSAALSMNSISATIKPMWDDCTSLYDLPWTIAKWPEKNILLVSVANTSVDDVTLCCNLQTGAWSRWTHIGARCLAYFDGYVFAGGNDGTVKRLETGGSDQGSIYTSVYVGQHEHMGANGVQKTALQARAMLKTAHGINPYISAQKDYVVDIVPAPGVVNYYPVGVWDASVWDASVWDGTAASTALTSYWRAIGRTGYSIAPELQMTFGGLSPPDVELVSVDMTFSAGAIVA